MEKENHVNISPLGYRQKIALFKLFAVLNKDNFWKPNGAPAKPWVFEYDLPVIGYSEFESNKNDNWFDEYLGKYVTINDSDWENEGRIVLFRKSIEILSKEYAIKSGQEQEVCFDDITTIVLLHELGHWIFHHMPTCDTKGTIETKKNKLYQLFNPDIKEAIAQFFVRITIESDNKILALFNWMIEEQPEVYQKDIREIHENGRFPKDTTNELRRLSELRNQVEECAFVRQLNAYGKELEDFYKDITQDENTDRVRMFLEDGKNKCIEKLPLTLVQYKDFSFIKRGKITGKRYGL